jgi:hypothetical protein
MLSSETTTLLCEYLPYGGVNDHTFPGWKEGPGGLAMCPLNSPQFFDAVFDYIYPRYHYDDISDQMSKLAKLAGADDDTQMIQYAQRVFERTTLWFVSHEFDREYHRQKLYLHLIAAHRSVSFTAWKTTLSYLRNPGLSERENDTSRAFYDKKDSLGNDKAGERDSDTRTRFIEVFGHRFTWEGGNPPVEVESRVFTRIFLEEVKTGGLKEYFDFVGLFSEGMRDPLLIREAWFVMILRGITWFKSQNAMGRPKPFRNGGAIPSSCWDNQGPVWMI